MRSEERGSRSVLALIGRAEVRSLIHRSPQAGQDDS